MKYQVVYIPRIENEVVLSQYNTKEEAQEHINYIESVKPKVLDFHYIKEISDD